MTQAESMKDTGTKSKDEGIDSLIHLLIDSLADLLIDSMKQ
jgi:hypothetical protein